MDHPKIANGEQDPARTTNISNQTMATTHFFNRVARHRSGRVREWLRRFDTHPSRIHTARHRTNRLPKNRSTSERRTARRARQLLNASTSCIDDAEKCPFVQRRHDPLGTQCRAVRSRRAARRRRTARSRSLLGRMHRRGRRAEARFERRVEGRGVRAVRRTKRRYAPSVFRTRTVRARPDGV